MTDNSDFDPSSPSGSCVFSRHVLSCATAFVALLLASLTVVPPSASQPADLDNLIDVTLDDTDFDGALWGVAVMNLDGDSLMYSRNSRTRLLPASNVKLFTTASALDQLGPDYRYRTTVHVDGAIRDSTLHGDLVVRGTGDPTLGHEDAYMESYENSDDTYDVTAPFRAWADSLKAAGITRINGNIVGDATIFPGPALGRGWSWDNTPYSYSAEISGLVFNRNTVDLTVKGTSIGEPGWIQLAPDTDYVEVENQSLTVPSRVDANSDYDRPLGTNTIRVGTLVPAGSSDDRSMAITDPARYFSHVLREVLTEEGIDVEGGTVALTSEEDREQVPPYSTLERIASHESPPLAEIIDLINEDSENLYAEQVLRTLGTDRPVEDNDLDEDIEPGTAEMGVAAAMRTLKEARVDTSAIQWADGSGLSRHNQKPPLAVAQLLRHMWTHPTSDVRDAFLGSLPVGGEDGTLSHRYRGHAAARGRVQAKTGTLSNVSALSGYVTTNGGTPLAFVIMCNHHLNDTSRVQDAQDLIVNALARQTW